MNALLRIVGLDAGAGAGRAAGRRGAQRLDRRRALAAAQAARARRVRSASTRRSCARRCCRTRSAASSRSTWQRAQDAVAKLPWVERAEVRKRWPDVLEVQRGRTPAVRALGQGSAAVASTASCSRCRRASRAGGLPQLGGPDARVPDVVTLYNESRALFAPHRPARCARCSWTARGSWSLGAEQRHRGRGRPQRCARAPAAASRACCRSCWRSNAAPLRARRPSLHQRFRADAGRRSRPPAAADAAAAIAGTTHESQGRQVADRRPRHRHLEGDRAGRRVLAGQPDRGDRHRLARIARAQARRGGRHRIHRAVDPARDRGGRADGRLRDPLGLRLDLRQPRAVPQLAGHRRRSATAK